MSIQQKLSNAHFTSNILYGSKLLSSFELVRGYTPSIEGTGKSAVPKFVIKAHKEMEARRLLARMLKSMPKKKRQVDVKVGEKILCLLPGGKRPRGLWTEEVVSEVPNEQAVVVGTGRNRKVIAIEDVRLLPKNDLASSTVRAQHDVAKPMKGQEEI